MFRRLHRKSHFTLKIVIVGICIFLFYNNSTHLREVEKKDEYDEHQQYMNELRQKGRQRRLVAFCKGKEHSHTERIYTQYMRLMYSDVVRLTYCISPKVASTNWKKMFLVFNGNMSEKEAKDMNKDLVVRDTYYSFMFTRHPFERLLATYRNKFLDPDSQYYKHVYGYQIRMKSNRALDADWPITFQDFVHYIINTDPSEYDEHWQLQTKLCLPCLKGFNYLGKMESLEEDAAFILRNAGLQNNYTFFRQLTDRYKEKTVDIMESFYRNITQTELNSLYRIYKDDFDAFGYHMPDYVLGKEN